MKKQDPSIGSVLAVGFLILIFWMVWLALYQQEQDRQVRPQQKLYYYVP